MGGAGSDEMGAYVLKRQNTVAQYIATRPIMNLYEETVHKSGAWVDRRWWEQEGLDLAGTKAAAAATAEDREGESEEEEEER